MIEGIAICPGNPMHQRFVTVAHVSQDWLVDEQGNFLECVGLCEETVAPPQQENTWTCHECGQEAVFVQGKRSMIFWPGFLKRGEIMKTPIPRDIVSNIIISLRETYMHEEGLSRIREINEGLCENFANDVEERLTVLFGVETVSATCQVLEFANFTGEIGAATNDEIFHEETLRTFGLSLPPGASIDDLNKGMLSGYGNHFFIEINHGDGLRWFYDAECPEGVTSPFLLPIGLEVAKNSSELPTEQMV